jgi:hypothetical protein
VHVVATVTPESPGIPRAMVLRFPSCSCVRKMFDENFCDGGRSMRGFNPSGKSPALEEYQPHPEELAKQASRRMDTTHGLAAILRDARKGALLQR